jgi:hypothetical protein
MRLFSALLLTACLLPAARAAEESAPADPAPATVEDPFDPFRGVATPLADALRAYARDAQRWAYTQRFSEFRRDGSVERTWMARFDPSQHYDVQWTLLERDGRTEVTESQQKSFRKRRLKRDQNQRSLGEVLDLRNAVLLAEPPPRRTPARAPAAGAASPAPDPASPAPAPDPVAAPADELVYEVPLLPLPDSRFPPEKFQVLVRVAREGNRLRTVEALLRDNFRVGLMLVNVKEGDAVLDFTDVRPDTGPAMTAIAAGGAVSIAFVPVSRRYEVARTEFKRVTPYDERFGVKLGPLKTIDF